MLSKVIPHWDYLSWARDRFGVRFALSSYPRAFFGTVKVPAGNDSILLRPGTTDTGLYDQIFLKHEYRFDADPKLIIDAGAHIGLASRYFAMRYPSARIVAIEPDDGNFRLLRKNVRRYPNITPIKAGLWGHRSNLRITNPEASPWSYQVGEGGDINGITVNDILSEFGVKEIGILKLDIEGAEIEVLQHSVGWMEKVHTLAIELHDRFRPNCSTALTNAIAGLNFHRQERGEISVLTRAA